jgi:hypothetical protein
VRKFTVPKTPEQIASEYKTFIKDTGGRCWRCGRAARDRPTFWNAPFLIERAHIDTCTHPRRLDRRCIWSACSLHHRIQHNDRFPGCADKPLTLPELLAIKKWADPEFYDRDFLKTCIIGIYLPPSASCLRACEVSWAVRKICKGAVENEQAVNQNPSESHCLHS